MRRSPNGMAPDFQSGDFLRVRVPSDAQMKQLRLLSYWILAAVIKSSNTEN